MKFNSTIVRAVAVLAIGSAVGVSAIASSSASPVNPELVRTTQPVLAADSVSGWNVKNGTLFAADMSPDLVKWFTAGPFYNTVDTNTVKDGALAEKDLNATVRAKLAQGNGQVINYPATTILTIGGPFATGKTSVPAAGKGALTLDAGTYLINTSAKFDRKDATEAGYVLPTTDTYPSLVVRYDTDGKDAGTIMGSPVSRNGFVELTGSSVKTIKLDAPTTLSVFGFGYNEDRSGFGGGQITVEAQVTATRIG